MEPTTAYPLNEGHDTIEIALYTVEPQNEGHIETSCFVLCREVVLSLEVDNVLVLWESGHLKP